MAVWRGAVEKLRVSSHNLVLGKLHKLLECLVVFEDHFDLMFLGSHIASNHGALQLVALLLLVNQGVEVPLEAQGTEGVFARKHLDWVLGVVWL